MSLAVKTLWAIQCSGLERQFRRHYNVEATGDHLDALDRNIRRNGGQVRPSIVADSIGDALRLNAINPEEVNIDGGHWHEDRFRFILEVDIDPMVGTKRTGLRGFISGYTDRIDLTSTNNIAEDTRFYVNSVVTVRDILREDSRGEYIYSQIVDNDQVIIGDYEVGGRFGNGNCDYLCRPVDVFNTLNMRQDLDMSDDAMDTRVMFDDGVELSRRDNNQGSRFLAKIINSDLGGRAESAVYGNDMFSTSRNSSAADVARERTIEANDFLRHMFSRSATFQTHKYFTYEELAPLCSPATLDALDDRVKLALRDMNNDYDYGSEKFHAAHADTVAAVTISHAVPSIMLDSLMTHVSFSCGNVDDATGNTEINTQEMHSFVSENFDSVETIRAFENRFINEVFNMLTNNGRIGCYMEVNCDMGEVCEVKIEMAGEPMQRYVFPTFCDSALTPVVSANLANLGGIAEGYGGFRKVIDNAIQEPDMIINDDVPSHRPMTGDRQSSRRSLLSLHDSDEVGRSNNAGSVFN